MPDQDCTIHAHSLTLDKNDRTVQEGTLKEFKYENKQVKN